MSGATLEPLVPGYGLIYFTAFESLDNCTLCLLLDIEDGGDGGGTIYRPLADLPQALRQRRWQSGRGHHKVRETTLLHDDLVF